MIAAPQPPRRRPAGPGRLLLVLAVLAGVLAMHGLGAGATGLAPVRAHAAHAAGHGPAQGAGHHGTAEDCSHDAGGQGQVHHADATCAATGISTPYAPPALAPALPGASAPAVFATRATAPATGGRAPPDLAELQLLRI
ncbi:DUF6153 family protein [Streptomyces subrutilus]|uniref:DUF1328 domain-containing protein n=1 Tax=Streptomyces subrutilus TaxID=36818 RepID=A0A1E5PZ17_9ACTN|nr:DUF6153 family protein [Streptomyces subrutilus]OEJ34779.1 hypothetical protein BGK67_28650 [Streptomyces subrutilus]